LGEDGLRLITQLINNIYETGVCPRDFSEVTMTTLKKPIATKCSNHHTSSLVTHTEKDQKKIVARIFRRRIERKIQDELGEDQCGFKK
jgi:hypothetical protein